MKVKLNKDYLLALVAVVLGLIAGAILIAITGNNPLEGYFYLFRGGLMNIQRIGDTLATATPLILTGLSVAFAFKTGLFNIGAAGQMLIGGLCATAVGLSLDCSKPILLTLVVLSAILGGALWGAVPGYLKARFNVHEVVSSIMMNWIAYWAVYYIVPAYFKGQFLETESRKIPAAASLKVDWLMNLFNGSYINLGFFLAVIAVIVIAFILNKTTFGYELKAVGYNRFAAESAGIIANQSILLSMVLAGALAGLGGAAFYVGYASNIQIGVSPSQGFDGIAVSLLGLNSPWGVLFAAIFFGVLQSGKGFMNAMTSIPPEIADTIIATIIYFAATNILIERAWERLRKRKNKGSALKKDLKVDKVGGAE
ncbi:MAG TPA: ABC transporter permease [Firmicutes bacterium]|jgi:general nucleoside transport system permease protein|nr:ABC transporter permease [Bacillota bacterium]